MDMTQLAQPTRTALVVESDDAMRELLRVHLANAGFRVLMAADAIVAGRTLLRMASNLDVLVVDTHLPYLSGTEFVSTLVADSSLPYVPVVLITRENELAPRTDLGVPSLVMPISADRLVKTIEKTIDTTTPFRQAPLAGMEATRQLLDRLERRRIPRDGSGASVRTARPLRLVIADDEHDTVTSLMAILCDEGHSVFGSFRGGEVLPTVRLERPDAVILDIDMPGISGYAVAREIREMFAESACPLLVAISGKWLGQTDKMLAELAGFHHFLGKPCDPKALLELLEPLKASTEI